MYSSPKYRCKKISVCNQPVISVFSGKAWKVSSWDIGTTEGGSSGFPLFNNSTHRIIGQLSWGESECDIINPLVNNGRSDYFGQLYSSLSGNGTTFNSLKDWLAPGCSIIDHHGLRYIRDRQINSNTNMKGDYLKLENITVASYQNIYIELNEGFEVNGSFNTSIGTSFEVVPNP